MFLRGQVATNDGSPVPHDVVVERVCNERVRQQTYATTKGDFSMQLGSRADSFLDASGDKTSEYGTANRDSVMGIPRHELTRCDLRASASGFHSGVISLVNLDVFGGDIDVGTIVVQRGAKIKGLTLSATPYQAPSDARKAYEKGIEAERKGRLLEARKYFETAVNIHPRYASAWYELASVLREQKQTDAARSALIKATNIDTKFLPPYLLLASMAYEAKNWTEVLNLTGHIMDFDPLNQGDVSTYILDLDPLSCNMAYFYNAFAYYMLNRIDDAEKSGQKAEHLNLLTHLPQLHLLMAEIYAQKNNYASAIPELQTYLELNPRAKNEGRIREQLARLEALNREVSTREKPN